MDLHEASEACSEAASGALGPRSNALPGLNTAPPRLVAMRALVSRGLRFLAVGGTCTVIAYGAFYGFSRIMHYQLANIAAWLCSCGVGFLLHRFVTYGIKGRAGAVRQFGLFIAGSLGQLAISAVGYAVLIGWLRLNLTLAFALNLAFSASLMFLCLERLTFRVRR